MFMKPRQAMHSYEAAQGTVTRPWPLGFAEEEFSQRWKVVKQVNYLLGEKKQRVQQVWTDTWAESEGETLSHALVVA